MLHQGEHVYIYRLDNSNTMNILHRWLDELVLENSEEYVNRVKYIWDPIEKDGFTGNVRMRCTVKVGFEAAVDSETAILSAMLVDPGVDCRRS